MQRLPQLSQHFLRSPQLVKELVGHTSISSADVVYDIGAGSGVITSVLAERAKKVVAVEIDNRMAAKLRTTFADNPKVEVRQADFLTLPLPRSAYKVFANIPFSHSSQIVQRLTMSAQPPTASYLIVQDQFARKLLPGHKGYTNQLAILVGVEFAVRIRRKLSPQDFYPEPRVPTVFLEIIKRPAPLVTPAHLARFKQFVTSCFANPRLLFAAPLHEVGLDPLAAPSSLTLDDWLRLFVFRQSSPKVEGMRLVEPTDPILNQKVTAVATNEFTSPHFAFIVNRMRSLAAGKGHSAKDTRQMVGLAAPQIGVNKRIILVDTTATGGNHKQNLQVFVNPQVIWRSPQTVMGREGCWSCGNICGVLPRAQKVKITAQDTSGKVFTAEFSDFVARIFQHEIDHLDGIRFPDRITDATKLHWVEPAEFDDYRKHWATWKKVCPRDRWEAMKSGSEG